MFALSGEVARTQLSTVPAPKGFRWRASIPRSNLVAVRHLRHLARACTAPHRIAVSSVVAAWLIGACTPSTDAHRVAAVTTDVSLLTLYIGPGGGQTRQLIATPRDGNGAALEGRTVTWASLSPSIVSVSPTGLVTALSLGSASITASSGGAQGAVSVTVVPVPVGTVSIAADSIALQRSPLAAGSLALGVQLRDSAGVALAPRPVFWASSAPDIAAVSAAGVVSAVGNGEAIVRVSVESATDSVVVTVTATDDLPDGFDIAIASVRWTQGSQNELGNIPMLLGGRDAAVLVTLSSPSELSVDDEIELRILDGLGAVLWADTLSARVEAGTASMLAPNVEFLVPSAVLGLDRSWQVRRDPRGLLADADADTDVYPADPQPLNAIDPPPLRIRFVPISLTSHGGATGDVDTGNVEEYLRMVRQIAPVGPIEVEVGPTFFTSTSFGTPPSGGEGSFWIPVLSQLDQARVASPTHSDWYWMGVVRPPSGFNFTAFGGYGYIPALGSSYGAGTRTALVVQVGWFNYEPGTRELVIHELGHNLGRFHAPCGSAAGPDPSFPIADGRIGDGGNDTWSFQQALTARAYPVAPNTGDVMGYCSPKWYGAYNYDGIVSFRGSATVALLDGNTRRNLLYVTGETDGRSISLLPPRSMMGVPSTPDPSGGWTAIGLDAAGAELFRFPFALARWDHEMERRPIAVGVPLDEALRERLHELRVVGPGGLGASLTLP